MPDRKRKLERVCLKISVTSVRPMSLVLVIFLTRVCIRQGGSVAPDTSNCRTPKENGTDRHRRLKRDRLEISVTYGRAMPLFSGIFLIRVSIYQGGSVPLGTSNCRAPSRKRPRSTAGNGIRLSGNMIYIWSPRAISFRGFPDRSKLLVGRFFFA